MIRLNNNLKRILGAALAAVLILQGIPAAAGETGNPSMSLSSSQRITYEVPGGKLYFEPDTGTIAWAEGNMTELTIPDKINGTTVKLIGRWKLSGLKNLKKINLPSGRNILGEGSLAELESLEEFTIPNTYDTIPRQCFYGCKKLKKVSMPASITSIGEMAFYGCTSLEYVDIPGNCLRIDKMAFYSCTGLKGVAFANGSEGKRGWSWGSEHLLSSMTATTGWTISFTTVIRVRISKSPFPLISQ